MDTGLNGMSGSSVMLHVLVEYSSEQETVWNLYMEVWTVLVMILSHRYVTKTHVLVSVFHVYNSATGYVSLWSTSKRLIGVWWDGWCKCIVKYTHLYANCKGLLKCAGRIIDSENLLVFNSRLAVMNRKNHLNRDFWVHFKTWIHVKVLNLPGFCLCILMTWFHYDIVDGEWSLWTKWSMCNVTCAGGLQHRYRICTLTAHGGADCNGTAEEYTECNTDPCPIVSELHWGYSQH